MKSIRPIYCKLIRLMVDALAAGLPDAHPTESQAIFQEAANIYKLLDLYEKQDPALNQLLNTPS